MILNKENPKDAAGKLVVLFDEFGKVEGYKNHTENLLHSYILKMKDEKIKLRKQSHFPLQKRIIYLGINLPKEANDLFLENYKTLMKEITQMERYNIFLDWKNQ